MLKYISVCICLLLYCKFISGKVCYVKFDEAGIIYNSTQGKDRNYNNSTYKYSTLLQFESKWEERNSLNSSDKVEKLILDQRWENFLVTDNINNTILTEYAFSAKIYSQVSNLLPEEPPRWKHFYVNWTGDNEFKIKEKGTDGWIDFKMESKPNNMYKIHNFTYYYNDEVDSCHDFKPKTNIPLPAARRCLHFYTAMCKNCSFLVEIHKNGKVNETTIMSKSNGEWNLYNICANNITNDFWVRVCPNGTTDRGFLAIAPQWILSSCENDFRFLEWKTDNDKDVTGCENVNNMNISKNENLNENCKLYATSKNEAMKLDPTKATTTSTSTTASVLNVPSPPPTFGASLTIILVTILLISIIAIAIAAIIYWYRRKKHVVKLTYKLPDQNEEIELLPEENTIITKKSESKTAIKRKDFAIYVKEALLSSEDPLKKQFDLLTNGFLRSHNVALKEENIFKNKYSKIIPYDDNRVVLKPNLGYPSYTTDYINASYVSGVNSDKEYIVAQNPLRKTATDFWYMIWQENVEEIITISTYDDKQFVKYWPDLGIKKMFDAIEIDIICENTYDFYKHRIFKVSAYNTVRQIEQYHYDMWSRKDEYMHSHTLVGFMNRLLSVPHGDKPILVHSHAGIGRVGALLLIDIALRQGISGVVDMFAIAQKLRSCRYSLLENANQYKLAHLVVIECLYYEDMSIQLSDDFINDIMKYTDPNSMLKNWEYLGRLSWIDEVLTPYQKYDQFPTKDRYANLVPFQHSKVELLHVSPNYINATLVKGYRMRRKFITTQHPLEHTVCDFWIMVLQNKVRIIVNLNELDEKNYVRFFPDELHERITPMSGITVVLKSREQNISYDIIHAEILDMGQLSRRIIIVNFKQWNKNAEIPPSEDSLYDVWEVLNNDMIFDDTTVISCDNGITACGLFVCYSYLIDKLHQERRGDVLGAIRAIRRSHSLFITYEQYEFLFKGMLNFSKRILK